MTPAGAAFKHHVDAMLHQLDDGLAAVSQVIDPETTSDARPRACSPPPLADSRR